MGDPLRDSREAKIFIFFDFRKSRDMYSKLKIRFLRFFGLDSKQL